MQFHRFDAAYLSRLRDGDPEVEEHFASYFGQLIRIKLSHRLRSHQGIDDVRQETFVRVLRILRSEEGVRQPESLGALVNSICNNVFHEAIRNGYRLQQVPEDAEPGWSGAGVLESLIAEEDALRVRRILDELSEKDRRLLSAVFLDESSRDALCAELKVTRDYLRVLLHRALEHFRSRFADATTASSTPESLKRSY